MLAFFEQVKNNQNFFKLYWLISQVEIFDKKKGTKI